jgi:hypothetical protein
MLPGIGEHDSLSLKALVRRHLPQLQPPTFCLYVHQRPAAEVGIVELHVGSFLGKQRVVGPFFYYLPVAMTMKRSAFFTDERRWAITTAVPSSMIVFDLC